MCMSNDLLRFPSKDHFARLGPSLWRLVAYRKAVRHKRGSKHGAWCCHIYARSYTHVEGA